MTGIKSRVVEAADPNPPAAEAVEAFVRAGWPRSDAEWLGPACLSALPPRRGAEGLDDVIEHNVRVLADAWNQVHPRGWRDRALLVVFARLCECGGRNSDMWYAQEGRSETPPRPKPGLAEWRTLAAEFRRDRAHAKGADFEGALVVGGWPGEYGSDAELGAELQVFVHEHRTPDFYQWPALVRLMNVLVLCASLDLERVIDSERLKADGGWAVPHPERQPRVPANRDWTYPSAGDSRLFINWLLGLGPTALALAFPLFQAHPTGAMAFGIRDAVERWLLTRTGHPTYFKEAGPELGNETRRYVDALERLCTSGGDPLLRRAWLWFAWCTLESNPDSLAPDRREAILRAASEDVARLRPLLRRAEAKADLPGPPDAALASWEEFEWVRDHLQTCLTLLYRFGGVWRGLKPMLLALRALSAPSVAEDLRYWQEDGLDDPPEPWCAITAWPINLFHAFARDEERSDAGLVALRGALVSFCLERLVDRLDKGDREQANRAGRRRSQEEMVEPSAEWRYCLVRAVTALGVNPGGAGHRVLHASSRIDPHPDVREAAGDAYERLRRGARLPPDVSPRRAVMSALWWIRQGHLLGLGIQPRADAAQRTRIKELTRTKEAERDDNPATRNN